MRTCIECRIDKPEEEFKKDGRYKDGLADKCEVCRNVGVPQIADDPESHVKLWIKQKCRCAICNRKTDLTKVYVDEDLAGRVRALLCKKCVGRIDSIRKNQRIWDATIEYLKGGE